ncbi:hypothetical protein NDU88_000552 [Pleurodeles waltl]|uniref:Uncharacterized protein n=1 Tax=Pleurodeles waltl TaxID=8319 RepID=A0AAV7TFD5_PLEWA|nr:hypothetical protein NDU88_000552 [Pleurodeles waltl]
MSARRRIELLQQCWWSVLQRPGQFPNRHGARGIGAWFPLVTHWCVGRGYPLQRANRYPEPGPAPRPRLREGSPVRCSPSTWDPSPGPSRSRFARARPCSTNPYGASVRCRQSWPTAQDGTHPGRVRSRLAKQRIGRSTVR